MNKFMSRERAELLTLQYMSMELDREVALGLYNGTARSHKAFSRKRPQERPALSLVQGGGEPARRRCVDRPNAERKRSFG